MFGGPDFIIPGVGRCGTTFMFRSALLQPEVVRCTKDKKEIRFFSEHYAAGLEWYRSFFPSKRGISGEATPSYLFHPEAALRIKKDFPKVRIACVFREPVARLWSHWRHLRYPGAYHKPFTDEPFETVVLRDYAKIQHDGLPDYLHTSDQYLGWGCYAHYLRKWIQVFPEEQIRFYFSEDLYTNPKKVLEDFFRFIGCTQLVLTDDVVNSNHHESRFQAEDMSPEFRKRMQDFYRPYNDQFRELLHIQLPKAWQY
jgi:hypothetical protein